jgi:serine/threonine-protein kinase HipA
MNTPETLPLAVYLHGERAGLLERLPGARLRFTYAEPSPNAAAAPISIALPPRPEPYEDAECAPFFAGLLPEGDFLRAVARAFSVSAENPFSLLAAIGGECAGALAWGRPDAGAPGTGAPPPDWLSEAELVALLDELPERPLALLDRVEEEDGVRISLAGAHDKFGVLAEPKRIGLTLGNPASSHILKLPIARVADPIANEAFCMELAAAAGLDTAAVEPRRCGEHDLLLVRRYDRALESPPDGRLHQEDFCQALRVAPEEKYENEGGPGVAASAALLWQVSSAPVRDVTAFLDALLFNFAIGNNDAHGKNYSLLLDGPESIRLAPLYDLLCTTVFDGSHRKLAMRYGGENRPNYLRRRHLDRLAGELDVKPALVTQRVSRVTERMMASVETARSALPAYFQERPILDRIELAMAERCERLTKAAAESP